MNTSTREQIDSRFDELVHLPTLETDNRKVHAYPWLLKKVEDGYALWVQLETRLADKVKIG
jgi:hypothetical protein